MYIDVCTKHLNTCLHVFFSIFWYISSILVTLTCFVSEYAESPIHPQVESEVWVIEVPGIRLNGCLLRFEDISIANMIIMIHLRFGGDK